MNKIQVINFTIQFIVVLTNLITYAIIARVIISWFSMGQMGGRGRISQLVHDITDPIINVFKKLPHSIGMIDLSPLIALLAIDFGSALIIGLLVKLGS